MAHPAVQAADEEHRGRDPGGRENRCVVAGSPLEAALAADDPDDPARQPQRRSGALEHGALFHMNFEEALRQRPPFDELRAADAAALLVTEDDGGTAADPLDRFDRGHDAERAVELAAVGHRVEVRTGPDTGIRGPADEVPGRVDLHGEAGLAHPLPGDLLRAVLALTAAAAIRAT